ncbi:MraY family glycosyltransferase [Streptomyces sp. NPDC057445]|uniref:MraY family glycosyltransferase n=1 Tax=Streptomyces sp. NPDC057445 TaxID=3346136 RepID=UPI0036884BDF
MLLGLAAATAALLVTAVLTEFVRGLALRTGVLDRPGARKAHTTPTPHLGGVAVVVGTLGVACSGPLTGLGAWMPGVGPLLVAGAAVAALGLVDDLRPLGPAPRLLVETVAATALVVGSGLGFLAGVLAVGWIVFVTNAFNLLDNSDGVLGTVGAVTALGLAVCAAVEMRYGLAALLCVLAAALSGFLLHNWHPARIFLGDCGSLFTGFVLASAAVTLHADATAGRAAGGLLALTLVVTADTALVTVSRRRAGRPLLQGGTDHTAHRLRRLGLTAHGAAVALGAVALVSTLTGLLVHCGWLTPYAVVPLALMATAACGGLLRVPVYAGQRERAVAGRRAAKVARPLAVAPRAAEAARVAGTRPIVGMRRARTGARRP